MTQIQSLASPRAPRLAPRGPFLTVIAAFLALPAWIGAQERIDPSAIDRIRVEGFARSQVMETASWLTDVYGPRLTGSPNLKAASAWVVKRTTEWG